MGGSNVTKQKSNETSQASSTGATSFNNTTTNSPYGPSSGLLKSILGQVGNTQGPDLSSLIPTLSQSAQTLGTGMLPQPLLDAIYYQAMNSAKSDAAAAGRDVTSPGYASSLGGAITRAAAPYSLQGMALAPSLISAAQGIPFANLFNKENLTLPIASAFGTTHATGTGTSNQTSQGQQQGLTTTTLPQNPLQTGIGGALGLLGLLSSGASGGLGGALGSGLAGFFK